MEFAFSGEADVGRECRGILLEEVAGAVSRLDAFSENPNLAVHETRKHNKRMRSVFLFARPVLDSADISRANRLIRDAAKLFSDARDAVVLQESCDKLVEHFGLDAEEPMLAKIRSRLALRHDRLLGSEAFKGCAALVSRDFADAGTLVAGWNWDQVTFEVVFSAVTSNYLLGRDDFERARESRDADDCHEWRKRAKYLSFHLALLNFLNPGEMAEKALAAEELASWLGEHHDMAVLQTTLAPGGGLRIAAAQTRFLIDFAGQRQEELELAAFDRGTRVYGETAEQFHERLQSAISAVV